MFSSMLEWPLPALRVNLPKNVAGHPDVARRSLLGTLETWDAPIWREVVRHLAKNKFPVALQASPKLRIEPLSTLAHLYHLTGDEMTELIPAEKWSIPILTPAQGAQIADGQLVPGSTVVSAPKDLSSAIQESLGWGHRDDLRDSNQQYLRRWRGVLSIVTDSSMRGNSFSLESYWMELSRWYLSHILRPVEIRFVTPPYPGLSPLTQIDYEVIAQSNLLENDVLAKAMDNPLGLNGPELCALHATWWARDVEAIVKAVPFGAPFGSFFATADGKLNLLHPMTCSLIQSAVAIRWHQKKQSRNAADLGHAEDLLVAAAQSLRAPLKLNSQVEQLREFLRLRGMIDLGNSPPVVGAGDYIPVSKTSQFMERALHPKNDAERVRFLDVTAPLAREFGLRIQKVEPEEAPEAVVSFMKNWKEEP